MEILRVDSLAAGGAGVARRATGEVVFVERSAPGDLVEAEVSASRPARGRVLRVIEAGATRVEPSCRFVEACGGCGWMHLDPAAQRAGHAAIVREALARIAGLDAFPEVRVHAAPAELGYRARARLLARSERGALRIGYRAHGSRELVAVDACAVLDRRLAPLLTELPRFLAGARGDGDVLVALGAGGAPVVDVAWRGDLDAATFAVADERVARGEWAGARLALEGASRPASFGDPRARMEGMDGAPLVIAEGSFAQTSSAGAALLAGRVAELSASPGRPRRVLELFAGSGTLSIGLATGAESFVAVEVAEDAARCARENLAARGLAGKVVCADADAFPIPPRTEVVVLDPPRAGAPGASAAIAAGSARVVVYVSCDPATLARDLAVLCRRRFAITAVETFELFPQTHHVEAVVRLDRAR